MMMTTDFRFCENIAPNPNLYMVMNEYVDQLNYRPLEHKWT